MVLDRFSVPVSKLEVSRWKEMVYRRGFERLELHHSYRALDFLVDHKDKIEEESVVSMLGKR